MSIKDKYIEQSVKALHKMHPEWNKDKLEKAVHHVVQSKIKDPTIILDNNITGDGATITLSKLCKWIDKTNPVISGNATFYRQPTDLLSPTSNMLRTLKKERKEVKKKMFVLDPKSDEYAALDLEQGNIKVIMNSDYGGSGAPTAAFYTEYSPPATTLMAQSIITTMAAFFESYLGDNQKFFNLNECVDWMNKVCEKDDKLPDWIVTPTPIQVSKRIIKHFYMLRNEDINVVEKYCEGCTKKELVYLYYANNFKDLIKNHTQLQNLLRDILSTLPNYEASQSVPDNFKGKFANEKEYNEWVVKQMFLNPYEIPEAVKKYMDRFIELMRQFVYVEYITPDSIQKLNNHTRNTVLLVDTDSNMILADLFVSFVLNEIFSGETFGRKSMYNEMILVNVICATLSVSVADMLDYYGRCHNMDAESRKELTMKNEFLFRTLFLMLTKKRYAVSIVLREGNIFIPFKSDIKGADFIKAGVTENVSKKFEKMLCDHILYSDDLELHELMRDLKKFEKEIYNDLNSGGMTYLKQQQYKSESGYKASDDGSGAWRLQVYKGSEIWNELNPDNKIYSLDRVHILKLKVDSPTDLDVIKDSFKTEYNRILNKVFNSEKPEIQKAGFKVICIPNSIKSIPEWLRPLIDYDMIISNIVGSFKSILEALRLEEVVFKTTNGEVSSTSCLISI